MEINRLCCLGFSHYYGIGPMRYRTLIDHFGSPEKAYLATRAELVTVLGNNLTEKFIQFRQRFSLEQKDIELQKKKISFVTQMDSTYPKSLKNISDPPICLYVKGEIKEVDLNQGFFFAIVETRKPTSYGQQIARSFSTQLSELGFIIVSGMATGVDSFAHRAAIEAGGYTVAVLGCGVDIVYPAANAGLYQQIIDKSGLIISEFPPGHTVLKGLFVARNRIISGLSRGALIIEGGEHSGALITARYAAEQGKDVFAPPAPITSAMSSAPNLLIKQGAKLVTSVEDILEEYSLKPAKIKDKLNSVELSDDERRIVELVNNEPLLADEISQKTQQPIEIILNYLSTLEIKGLVEKTNEGRYQIK